MSKYDAEQALNIYKIFGQQTNQVVDYLSTARSYENATRLEIPKLKHAPISLTGSLEEYLNDPDFEINRRQYLAQQGAQKGQKSLSNGNNESSKVQPSRPKPQADTNSNPNVSPAAPPTPAKPEPTGPAPDLIDLFDSIEQNQQPMAIQSQPQIQSFQVGPHHYPTSGIQLQQSQPQLQLQQTGFPVQLQNLSPQSGQAEQQVANPFGNLSSPSFPQPNPQTQVQAPIPSGSLLPTAGFGSYPQPLFSQTPTFFPGSVPNSYQDFANQQNPLGNSQQQAQSTNPFRQSIFPQPSDPSSLITNVPQLPSQVNQSTNPFARSITPQSTNSTQQIFMSAPQQSQPSVLASTPQGNQYLPFQTLQAPEPPQPIQPSQPIQYNLTGTNPFARNLLSPQTIPHTSTGSTNPFRQTPFAAQQTWQANQGTIGGLEHLETVPVFPRPGQQSPPGPGHAWP